jgi:transcriptional regulator with XRE-family HTH domain
MNAVHPLRAYRQSQTPPLTKAELARKLGVSKTTIARWEKGIRKIEPELLIGIAEETGIPAKDLRPDLVEHHEKIFGEAAQ